MIMPSYSKLWAAYITLPQASDSKVRASASGFKLQGSGDEFRPFWNFGGCLEFLGIFSVSVFVEVVVVLGVVVLVLWLRTVEL